MKTQSVSFQGKLKIGRSVSPEVKNAIELSPAMKRFGRMYDAEVFQINIGSSAKSNGFYAGLFLDNVKPRNIFVTIFDVLTGRQSRRYSGFAFNSYKDEAGLIKKLGKMNKNAFLKMVVNKY